MERLTRLFPWRRQGGPSSNPSCNENEAILSNYQSGAPQTHYFDGVSPEILFLVLRHLSKQPFSKYWMEWLEVKDVETVLRLGGPLSAASQEMFKSLEHEFFAFNSWVERPLYVVLGSLMAPGLESLVLYPQVGEKISHKQLRSLRVLTVSCNFRRKDLSRILNKHGESLGVLDFDIHRPFDGIVYNFEYRWRDLKRIQNAPEESLQEFGFHVKKLNRAVVRTIADNCKSLKVFTTNFHDYGASLEPIWKAASNTLVEFRGCVPKQELVHIARHCIRLQKLELTNIEDLILEAGKELVDLLRALKTLRILVLVLHYYHDEVYQGLSTDLIRMLVEACPPNVRIHGAVTTSHESGALNFMRGVSTHLHVFRLEYSFDTMPTDIGPVFGNVEDLVLSPVEGYSDKVIELVFVEPLPHLRRLFIGSVRNSKILHMVARSVHNLRELECLFGLALEVEEEPVPVVGSDFADLLHTNVHLRYISVDFVVARELVTSVILDFIPLLKVCRFLEHVDINNGLNGKLPKHERLSKKGRLKEISDACIPLRTKSLSLSAIDVCYLPS